MNSFLKPTARHTAQDPRRRRASGATARSAEVHHG